MKKIFLFLTFIVSITASAQATFSEVQTRKPFKRVLILSGGGMKTSTYLGLVSALVDSGQAPDLIFSACGPAFATAIMQTYPDHSTWLSAVQSPAYHNLLREVQLNNSSAIGIISRIFNQVETQNIPFIFKKYALNIPTTIDSNSTQLGLDQKFNNNTIPVIMVAAELSYGPQDVGRVLRDENGLEKLYQEVFFTDSTTALKLGAKLVSPIASMKGNRVFPEIKVITTATLFEASRASVSDPYYMEPMMIGSKYYQTGGVDLYPIEQAQALADEVIVAFAGNYTWIETQAVINTFGYQANDRVKNILQQSATRWIDMTDGDLADEVLGFDPVQKFLKIVSQIPNSDIEITHRIDLQWAYGRERALEALSRPINVMPIFRSDLPKKSKWSLMNKNE